MRTWKNMLVVKYLKTFLIDSGLIVTLKILVFMIDQSLIEKKKKKLRICSETYGKVGSFQLFDGGKVVNFKGSSLFWDGVLVFDLYIKPNA